MCVCDLFLFGYKGERPSVCVCDLFLLGLTQRGAPLPSGNPDLFLFEYKGERLGLTRSAAIEAAAARQVREAMPSLGESGLLSSHSHGESIGVRPVSLSTQRAPFGVRVCDLLLVEYKVSLFGVCM